jgi:hypothetical protein
MGEGLSDPLGKALLPFGSSTLQTGELGFFSRRCFFIKIDCGIAQPGTTLPAVGCVLNVLPSGFGVQFAADDFVPQLRSRAINGMSRTLPRL